MKVSVDGREFLADPEEKRQFDDALAMLRNGDFDKAAASFGGFLRRYPGQRLRRQRALLAGQCAVRQARVQGSDRLVSRPGQQRAGPSARARGAAGGGQLPGRGQGHQGRARHHRRADQGLPEVRSRAGGPRAACGAKVARRGSGRARRQASKSLASPSSPWRAARARSRSVQPSAGSRDAVARDAHPPSGGPLMNRSLSSRRASACTVAAVLSLGVSWPASAAEPAVLIQAAKRSPAPPWAAGDERGMANTLGPITLAALRVAHGAAARADLRGLVRAQQHDAQVAVRQPRGHAVQGAPRACRSRRMRSTAR